MGLEDQVRPEARDVLAALNALIIKTVMLTGDNNGVAERVSRSLGLSDYQSELLPEQKLAALDLLKQQNGTVAMLGDGINDSPAIARADVGIAMGGVGNAQVLETADVVLMNDDLSKLPFAIKLARFANLLIKQNVVISLGVKFLVAIVAVLGLTPLWVAILGDVGISLVVTLNGLRAMRYSD
jgi:Cd2+/Zn2+-exporting ATPase